MPLSPEVMTKTLSTVAEWFYREFCESNPTSPVCAGKPWHDASNIKGEKCFGQRPLLAVPWGALEIDPYPEYDTVFRVAGNLVKLNTREIIGLGLRYRRGRTYSVTDSEINEFLEVLSQSGPEEFIRRLQQ